MNTPRIGATVDNAWRAAALVHAADEGIDAPCGTLVDLARDIDAGRGRRVRRRRPDPAWRV